MAYDERLAERIREALSSERGVSERRMFGGLAFMVRGHMCVGIVGDELMVRVGPGAYEDALRAKHAREMDFTGRAMKGMVYVAPEGARTAKSLRAWIERGLTFTSTLPAKG